MPGKKDKTPKTPQVEQIVEDPQEEEPKPDSQVNDRLTRIEEAILCMAELQEARQQEPTGAVTRGRAQKAKSTKKPNTRRSVSLDSSIQRDMNIDHNLSAQGMQQPQPPANTTVVADVHSDARHHTSGRPSARGDLLTSQPGDPLTNVNKPQPGTRLDHNNADCWAPWMSTLPAPPQPASRPPFNPIPSAAYGYDQDEMEQHVQSILASSVHTLSRGNVKPGAYPFKYVFRGPDKKRVSINSVSLSEHLWGLVRMIKDPAIDPFTRPALINHLEEIIEDSCDYEWAGIRRWSEEVFSLMAENRLPDGWRSTQRIQMLRMMMARTPLAPPVTFKDFQPKRQVQSFGNDQTKGGPPCQAYNTQAGCPLPAGHVDNGRKMMHVCTYCLRNSSAAYTHPESQCRNKYRATPQHFKIRAGLSLAECTKTLVRAVIPIGLM